MINSRRKRAIGMTLLLPCRVIRGMRKRDSGERVKVLGEGSVDCDGAVLNDFGASSRRSAEGPRRAETPDCCTLGIETDGRIARKLGPGAGGDQALQYLECWRTILGRNHETNFRSR